MPAIILRSIRMTLTASTATNEIVDFVLFYIKELKVMENTVQQHYTVSWQGKHASMEQSDHLSTSRVQINENSDSSIATLKC
jgi:hypothetical protein